MVTAPRDQHGSPAPGTVAPPGARLVGFGFHFLRTPGPARCRYGAPGWCPRADDEMFGVEGVHVLCVTAGEDRPLVIDVETDPSLTAFPDCGVATVGHGRRGPGDLALPRADMRTAHLDRTALHRGGADRADCPGDRLESRCAAPRRHPGEGVNNGGSEAFNLLIEKTRRHAHLRPHRRGRSESRRVSRGSVEKLAARLRQGEHDGAPTDGRDRSWACPPCNTRPATQEGSLTNDRSQNVFPCRWSRGLGHGLHALRLSRPASSAPDSPC